eukprot:scaffold239693_cov28-Tisochrysis_lutea.AAC.1
MAESESSEEEPDDGDSRSATGSIAQELGDTGALCAGVASSTGALIRRTEFAARARCTRSTRRSEFWKEANVALSSLTSRTCCDSLASCAARSSATCLASAVRAVLDSESSSIRAMLRWRIAASTASIASSILPRMLATSVSALAAACASGRTSTTRDACSRRASNELTEPPDCWTSLAPRPATAATALDAVSALSRRRPKAVSMGGPGARRVEEKARWREALVGDGTG